MSNLPPIAQKKLRPAYWAVDARREGAYSYTDLDIEESFSRILGEVSIVKLHKLRMKHNFF
jgi:hypothetical protein